MENIIIIGILFILLTLQWCLFKLKLIVKVKKEINHEKNNEIENRLEKIINKF